mgnify:FL=1
MKTTIRVSEEIKSELDNLKICRDESYNSLLERVLPKWVQILRFKLLEEEAEASTSNLHHEES